MKGLSATEERARREGWADAVVMLAMCDPRATTAADLADQLRRGLDALDIPHLTDPEIRAALRRWKARQALASGLGPTAVARALTGDQPPPPARRPIQKAKARSRRRPRVTPLDARGRQVLTCRQCGAVRTRKPTSGQPPAYCSDECRTEANNARNRRARPKEATDG